MSETFESHDLPQDFIDGVPSGQTHEQAGTRYPLTLAAEIKEGMEQLQSYILTHPDDEEARNAYEDLMEAFRRMHVGAAAVAAGKFSHPELGGEKSPIS